jgi:hypothetical protein
VLRRDVLLTGFSQGASAATGLAKALQLGADDRPGSFRPGAVAPISGAYDLRHAEVPAMLRGELDPFWSTAYTAYLLVAWNRLHHLYDSPADVFAPAYAGTVEALFDGDHTGEQVGAGLPASLDELLTPAGRQLVEHPGRRALPRAAGRRLDGLRLAAPGAGAALPRHRRRRAGGRRERRQRPAAARGGRRPGDRRRTSATSTT